MKTFNLRPFKVTVGGEVHMYAFTLETAKRCVTYESEKRYFEREIQNYFPNIEDETKYVFLLFTNDFDYKGQDSSCWNLLMFGKQDDLLNEGKIYHCGNNYKRAICNIKKMLFSMASERIPRFLNDNFSDTSLLDIFKTLSAVTSVSFEYQNGSTADKLFFANDSIINNRRISAKPASDDTISIIAGDLNASITTGDLNMAITTGDLNSYYLPINNSTTSISALGKENSNMATSNSNSTKNSLSNMFGNFDFGPMTADDKVRLSLFGLAVENSAGQWVSYNKATQEMMDVAIVNFEGQNMMFKMPVALQNIQLGDIVMHNGNPVCVTGFSDNPDVIKLIAVDVRAGEEKIVLPLKNMFGFNFVTKVVSLMDMMGGNMAPTPDMPFGNMMPLIFMMGDNNDMNPMMAMALGGMMNNGSGAMNPMMAMCMAMCMGDSKSDKDMTPLMMAMAMSGGMNNMFSQTPQNFQSGSFETPNETNQ